MKQYFLKETDKRLSFGDQISFNITKEDAKGKKTEKHVDCLFTLDTIPLLLAEEIIEEKDVPDSSCSAKEGSNYDLDSLQERLSELEGTLVTVMQSLNKRVSKLEKQGSTRKMKLFGNEFDQFTILESLF